VIQRTPVPASAHAGPSAASWAAAAGIVSRRGGERAVNQLDHLRVVGLPAAAITTLSGVYLAA
jgi:hypothetical protein